MGRRGRPKGLPRTGGRQKGTPNKATVEVAAKLAALGCDPIEGMAQVAAHPESSLELRGRMYAELAQYVAPKRKAVEVSGPNGGPQQVETIDRPGKVSRAEWIALRNQELGGV